MEEYRLKIMAAINNPKVQKQLTSTIGLNFPKAFVSACTLDHVLNMAEAVSVDIIIIDITIPGYDVIEVCRRLKSDKNFYDIPVVIITPPKKDKSSCVFPKDCLPEAFLSLPIDENELTAILHSMVKIRTANLKTNDVFKLNEEKFRKITEYISDVIWITDLNLNITYISPSVERLLGESVQIHMRRTLEERYPLESLLKLRLLLSEEIELETDPNSDKNRTRTVEVQQYRADGTLIWISMHVWFLRDEDGAASALTGISSSMERIQIENELQHSHDLTRYIIENVRGAIAVFNKEMKYLYASHGYKKDFEIEEIDIIGRHHYDVFPHLPQRWKDAHQKALKGEILSSERDIVPRKNGSIDWGRWDCRPWYEIDGSIGGIVIYSEIITEYVKAEEALRESENLYRTFIEASNDMIYIKDDQLRYLVANKSLVAYYDVSMQSIIGKDDYALMPEKDAEQCRNNDVKALADNCVIISEEVIGDKVFETTKFPVKLPGNNTGVGGFIHDITKRKETENKLRFLSYYDYLTGLHNRRFFEEELERLDTEKNFPISIIMCDLNGLKLINDSLGHAEGDKLLKKASKVITTVCGKTGITARIGGDEFVSILPNTDGIKAAQIVCLIEDLAQKAKNGSVKLSVSCGYDTKETKDQRMLDVLANAENHMYRHKLYESSSMRSITIDMIMNTLFEKSNREMLHSKRVSELCEEIAEKLNFKKDNVNEIRIAGLMHDIGKIGIDEKILNKPGKLDLNEWKEMKKHSEAGWRILKSVNEFSKIAGFILEHHEMWDGNGYPSGLTGENISVEARIIAIADAFDAMTRDRSYRKGLSTAEAISEIERCSGTQFDPYIASAFITLIKEKNKV